MQKRGGVQPNFSAVGRKQQFPQSNAADSAVGKKLSIVNLQLGEANCQLSIVNCALLILLCLFFSVNAFAQYGGGNGTEGNPYKISTAAHLSELATNVNGGNAYSGRYFKVTANINSGNTIIGCYHDTESSILRPFSGTFDGDGHTITIGISTAQKFTALFAYVLNGTIKNLTVSGSATNTEAWTAGIVSYAYNSHIYKCTNRASISGSMNLSGVVGSSNSSTIVEKCTNDAAIGSSMNNWIRAGVVCTSSNSSIIECTNTSNGIVKGTEALAGITCSANSTIIDKCVNNGLITGNTGPYNSWHTHGFAGIVAYCESSSTVRNCYNSGSVYFDANAVNGSYYYVGGIAGYCEYSNVNIKNCYNIGDVKTRNNCGCYIGGICGISNNAFLENCYNGGKVSNTDGNYQYIGAITGYVTISGGVVNCYAWDGSAVNSGYSDTYKLRLYGSYVSGCTLSDNVWFTHNSNTDNRLKSNVSVNGTSYTASNTNSLLTVLNAWVTANGNDYLTWVNATSESDNKGMPKLKFCTPISTSITSVASSHRKNVVVWTSDPQNPTCTYSVSWTSSAGNGNSSATSPFNHTGLTNDVSYCYRVVAVGTGDYCDVNEPSAQVCGTPHCTPLSAPTLNIQNTGDRTVTVSWGTVSGALSYRLDYGSNSSSMWEVTPDSNPYTVLRLTNGQTYNFKIKAVGDEEHCGTDNPLSSTVSATPECNE